MMTLRNILIALAVAVLITLIWSIWWLRPAYIDGSRYAFMMLHKQAPFFDNRITHGLFQIPSLIWSWIDPASGPRTLTRIYLYTLTVPVFLALIFKMVRAKSFVETFIFSSFLFAGLLPGISYAVSSVFETAFFFLLLHQALIQNKKWQFYLWATLAAFGHPAFIFAFFLSAILIFLDHKIYKEKLKWKEILFLLILMPVQYYSIYSTNRDMPGVAGNWKTFALDYIQNAATSEKAAATLVAVFTIILCSDFLVFRRKNLFQGLLFLLMILLPMRVTSFHLVQKYAYNFRLFTVGMAMVLGFYFWIWKWKNCQPSRITVLSLILVATCFTYWDFRISHFQKGVYDYVSTLRTTDGCMEVPLTKEQRAYTFIGLTNFKILADDSWNLEALYLDNVVDEACKQLRYAGSRTLLYPTGFGTWVWFEIDGRFQLSEKLISAFPEKTP